MNVNTDYAQYRALAERDAYLEDTLNGIIKETLKKVNENDESTVSNDDAPHDMLHNHDNTNANGRHSK